MAVSTIDGTVKEAVLKRTKRGLHQYERVVFELADGSSKTWANAVVHESVAAHLQPGARGRFYLYSTLDHRGIHGVRTADGASIHHFSSQYETFAMSILILFLALGLLSVLVGARQQVVGIIILLLAAPLYLHYRSTRLQTQAQFDADGEYRAVTPAEAAAGAG